jgi:hypothetical protein
VFIPRGAVHHHENRHSGTATSLVILTPATIGPAYFQEMSELIKPGVQPDLKKATEIMLRHGLIPAVY